MFHPLSLTQAYGVQKPYVINNLIMAIALVVLVLMTCMMTYIQEKSASDVMNSLKRMMPNTVGSAYVCFNGLPRAKPGRGYIAFLTREDMA